MSEVDTAESQMFKRVLDDALKQLKKDNPTLEIKDTSKKSISAV